MECSEKCGQKFANKENKAGCKCPCHDKLPDLTRSSSTSYGTYRREW